MKKDKTMKLINLHWEWMGDGLTPYWGLCAAFRNEVPVKYKNSFSLIQPDYKEQQRCVCDRFWGKVSLNEATGKYNSFRQTIVLFICAMHGEL